MKRHNFSGQPASHGASDRERAPGSSGRQQPQRVIKGTKKPGHFGVDRVTTQRLEIMGVDKDNNKILVKGAIAGPSHGTVYLKNTVKRIKKKVAPPVSKKKVTVEKKKK
jgi:large subunit ribosomal protein L3